MCSMFCMSMRVFLHLVQVYFVVRDGTYILAPHLHIRKPENSCTVGFERGVRVAACWSRIELHLFQSSSEIIAGQAVKTHSLSGFISQRFVSPKLLV